MSAKGGPGGDRLGIGEIYWFRYDLAEDDRLIEVLSDKGELFFYRLRKHYLYRAGTLPYDPSAICTKMGYKTVRPFNACFEELVAAGLVSVENGMVRFPHGDRLIADIQSNRDRKANEGRVGGETKAANARNVQETSANVSPNFEEVSSKHETKTQQNQPLGSSYQKTSNHESVNKTTSVGSTAAVPPRQNGGGGGSEIQQIIAGFDSRIVDYWGEDARRDEPAKDDALIAGQWLAKAGGSVEDVLNAVDAEMEKERGKNSGPPGSLKAYRVSVPAKIVNGVAPRTTNGNGKAVAYAGPSRAGGNDVWTEICSIARNNWHDDVAIEIRRRAVEISDEEANRFAESMRSFVSTKKAQAAA